MFLKICFARFPPFYWSRYSCEYKNRFYALFPDDLFPNIFCSHYSCVSGKLVSRVFTPPRFFGSRYSYEYKKRFFALFSDDLFPTFFACTIREFLEKLFHAFFPPFFGHDIRVNIKNVYSPFFPTIFFPHFLLALFLCFWKNCFELFFSIFWPRYLCEYKKSFFRTFFRRFFPNIFLSHYSCVFVNIVSRVFSPQFLVTIFL